MAGVGRNVVFIAIITRNSKAIFFSGHDALLLDVRTDGNEH